MASEGPGARRTRKWPENVGLGAEGPENGPKPGFCELACPQTREVSSQRARKWPTTRGFENWGGEIRGTFAQKAPNKTKNNMGLRNGAASFPNKSRQGAENGHKPKVLEMGRQFPRNVRARGPKLANKNEVWRHEAAKLPKPSRAGPTHRPKTRARPRARMSRNIHEKPAQRRKFPETSKRGPRIRPKKRGNAGFPRNTREVGPNIGL